MHIHNSYVSLTQSTVEKMRTRAVALHPAEHRITATTHEWATRFGLISGDLMSARHAAIRCGSFAAHTYPHASEALVGLGADLIAWLFIFDDCWGEGAPGDTQATMRALREL